MTAKESHFERKKFISSFVFLSVAAAGIFIVLYAWNLPPFHSRIQSTENAMVRGQVTLISPQLSGYVTEVPVQDFQQVKKGDLLVQIDDRIYRQRYDQAKAQLAVKKAELENNTQDRLSAEASIEQGEAVLANAKAQEDKATNEYKRNEALVSSGAVSKSVFDTAKALYMQNRSQTKQAKAALAIAKQDLQRIIVKHNALEAEVESGVAILELAQIDLDNTHIAAPNDGQLGQVTVRSGAYVTAGTQLMGLVPDYIWINANMKETQMAHIQVGQIATFTVDALDNTEMRGRVERISPASGSEFSVIPPDNATGNFVKISQRIPVRISIDPAQSLSEKLKPGMSVVVHIETD